MERTSQPSRRYRLLALDLDGTLIGKELTISASNREAVQAAIEAGIHVTLASGRMFQSALPFACELGIRTPLICYQGALIQDPVTREVIFHRPILLEDARQAIEVATRLGVHINAYLDDELYVSELTPQAQRYAEVARVPAHVVGDLLSFVQRPPTKLVIVSDEETTVRLVHHLKELFGSRLYISRSYPIFCEIAHPDCSKSHALAVLATHLGVSREETVAVGDNWNDVDMVEWAGLGVATADASPEVTAVADRVTASLEDDGVAQLIYQVILQ